MQAQLLKYKDSDFVPKDVFDIYICRLVGYFEVRESAIVVRHDNYSNVFCAVEKWLACVDSRVSFYNWWDMLPGLLFAGFTVADSVCAPLEMVDDLSCLASYSILDLWQHLCSFFCHLNVTFSHWSIYPTSFLLTVGVILCIENVIDCEEFIHIAIIIDTYATLICKTTWTLPFFKGSRFLRLTENFVTINLQHSHCSFLEPTYLNQCSFTCTG